MGSSDHLTRGSLDWVFVERSSLAGMAGPPSMGGPPSPPGTAGWAGPARREPNLGKATDGSLND